MRFGKTILTLASVTVAAGIVTASFFILNPPAPEQITAPQLTPSPATTSTPDKAHRTTVIPSCDALFSAGEVQDIVGSDAIQSVTEKRYIDFYRTAFGPSAMKAYTSSPESVECAWAYPNSDAGAAVFIAKLSPEEMDLLMSSLRDSVFHESTFGDATVFSDTDPERRKSMPVHYGFIGDVWVSVVGQLPLFEPALNRVADLNS